MCIAMNLRKLALGCFFLSGATGLLYQVLWSRLLGQTLGNTHVSITVVVAVFMGGLAFGSYMGGKLADRSRSPVRLYGVLNLLAAALCLVVPFVADLGQPIFRALYAGHDGDPQAIPLVLARIVFSALLILAPTTCMGATLPVLARYFATRLSDIGHIVGRLYAINTFGAVVGVFFAGFWAMEHIGVLGTTYLAVAIDVFIGIAILVTARGDVGSTAPAEPVATIARGGIESVEPRAYLGNATSKLELRAAILAFAVAGFANMALEVAWTKAIVQTIGNSTYAFSLIVTLFILGIGIGGAAMTPFVDRLRRPYLALGIAIAGTGLLVSGTVPLLGFFPIWGARLFDAADEPNYDTFLRTQIGLVSLAILPATTLMGTVFPIVSRIRTRAVAEVGSAVGSAYFANTLGAILGTLAAGFVFIPLFGRVYWTLYLAAAISLVTGLAIIGTARGTSLAVRGAIAASFIAVVAAVILPLRPHGVLGSDSPLWDPAILSRGAYVYFHGSYYKDRKSREVRPIADLIHEIREGNKVLSYREGIHAPVAVVQNPLMGIAMRISGKVDASLPEEGGYSRDMPHQILAGHLPMLLHPGPKEVLTLGLGGGVTLGTLTLYPVREIDSLEISTEVIEAARDYFSRANRGALGSTPLRPVRHIVGDGRNHLLYTTKSYDVITSVPSNPWIAGIGTLFTEEFFQICKDRLRPGGIVCNWIHKINMRESDIRIVFRTFERVFGETTQLWDLGYDCLLIGGTDPIPIDATRIAELLENPEIRRDLGSLGIVDAPTLLRHFRWQHDSLSSFSGEGPLQTDALPILEFSCPRGLYGYRLDAYRAIAEVPPDLVSSEFVVGLETVELDRARRLQGAFANFERIHWKVDIFESILAARKNAGSDDSFGVDPATGLRVALEVSPSDRARLESEYEELIGLFIDIERSLPAARDPWLSGRVAMRARTAFGGSSGDLETVLIHHFRDLAGRLPDFDARIPHYERALQVALRPEIVRELTAAALESGKPSSGRKLLEPHLTGTVDPRYANALGILEAASGDYSAAERTLSDAAIRAGDDRLRAEILSNLGHARLLAGRPESARESLEEALRLEPGHPNARAHLSRLEAENGQR
jgi:spermidine synthase